MQGVARLRYSVLTPLYQSNRVNREVAVHQHFVNESLSLFLFYFLQLAVMATYISQDLLKLVPLLTIIFVFGRYVCSLQRVVKCLASKPRIVEEVLVIKLPLDDAVVMHVIVICTNR